MTSLVLRCVGCGGRGQIESEALDRCAACIERDHRHQLALAELWAWKNYARGDGALR